MQALSSDAAELVRDGDWLYALYNSDDSAAVREILVRCAEIMLPYWDARFHRDEAMGKLISAMHHLAAHPNLDGRRNLESLIPERRVYRHGGLSPPPGFPEPADSDCPADFAGDTITHAALAMSGSSQHLHAAMDTAIETFARLFGERDPDEDSPTDHRAVAGEYLRAKLLGNTEEPPDAREAGLRADSNGTSRVPPA